jgi:hypothetical protein
VALNNEPPLSPNCWASKRRPLASLNFGQRSSYNSLLAISSCTVLYFRRSAIVVAIPAPFLCQNFIAHNVIIITSIFSHHQQLCLFPTFRRGSGRVGNTISEVVEYESQYIPSQVRGAHGEKQHMFLRAFSGYQKLWSTVPRSQISFRALVRFAATPSKLSAGSNYFHWCPSY